MQISPEFKNHTDKVIGTILPVLNANHRKILLDYLLEIVTVVIYKFTIYDEEYGDDSIISFLNQLKQNDNRAASMSRNTWPEDEPGSNEFRQMIEPHANTQRPLRQKVKPPA